MMPPFFTKPLGELRRGIGSPPRSFVRIPSIRCRMIARPTPCPRPNISRIAEKRLRQAITASPPRKWRAALISAHERKR